MPREQQRCHEGNEEDDERDGGGEDDAVGSAGGGGEVVGAEVEGSGAEGDEGVGWHFGTVGWVGWDGEGER